MISIKSRTHDVRHIYSEDYNGVDVPKITNGGYDNKKTTDLFDIV